MIGEKFTGSCGEDSTIQVNRLVGKSYSNASGGNCAAIVTNAAPVSYSYDQGTNGNGQRTAMDDGSGTASWTYDSRGRATQETRVVDGARGGTFVTQWGSYGAAAGE